MPSGFPSIPGVPDLTRPHKNGQLRRLLTVRWKLSRSWSIPLGASSPPYLLSMVTTPLTKENISSYSGRNVASGSQFEAVVAKRCLMAIFLSKSVFSALTLR